MQYYCSSCTDHKHTVLVYVDSRFSSCLILLLSVSSVLSWSSRCCCCCCCWAGKDPTLRREPTSREAELINTFSPLGSLCNPIICIINYVGCIAINLIIQQTLTINKINHSILYIQLRVLYIILNPHPPHTYIMYKFKRMILIYPIKRPISSKNINSFCNARVWRWAGRSFCPCGGDSWRHARMKRM